METEIDSKSQVELESHKLEFQIGLIPAEEIPEEKTIGLMRESLSKIFRFFFSLF